MGNQKKMSVIWGLKSWNLVKLVVVINQVTATLKLLIQITKFLLKIDNDTKTKIHRHISACTAGVKFNSMVTVNWHHPKFFSSEFQRLRVIFCPVITNGITFLSTWSSGLVMSWPFLFNSLCFLYIGYNFFSVGRRATQLHTLSKTEGQISYLIIISKTSSQPQDWQQTWALNSFAVLARTDVTMIYPWISCRCSKNTLNNFCKYS